MMDETLHQKSLQPFPETCWTVIRDCRDPQGEAYQSRLDSLFRRYWPPVYSFIYRNWTRNVEEAKDHTQAFFTVFMEKNFLKNVEAERGRFRNFVCVALRHFLSKRKRAARAKKRYPSEGSVLSLDGLCHDQSSFEVEDSQGIDPQEQFDSDWKQTVIDLVLERFRERGRELGKEAYVEIFLEHDLYPQGGEKPSYEHLAECHDLTLNQVKNGLYWSRKEFRSLFVEELQDQVASPEELKLEAWELYGLKI